MVVRALLWCLLWGVATPAFATTVVEQGVEELALDSTAVIEARVGQGVTSRFADQWYTDFPVDVLAVHAGSAPALLTLRQFGGEIDGMRAKIPGDAELVPGRRFVAFVRQVDGLWYLTSLGQSLWHVEEGPKQRVRRDLEGLHFFQQMRDGSFRPAIESRPEYTTLPELVRALDGLRMGEAR